MQVQVRMALLEMVSLSLPSAAWKCSYILSFHWPADCSWINGLSKVNVFVCAVTWETPREFSEIECLESNHTTQPKPKAKETKIPGVVEDGEQLYFAGEPPS